MNECGVMLPRNFLLLSVLLIIRNLIITIKTITLQRYRYATKPNDLCVERHWVNQHTHLVRNEKIIWWIYTNSEVVTVVATRNVKFFFVLQLAREKKVTKKAARLFLDMSEKGRHLVETYFDLKEPLYFDYTHLVCRTALDGKMEVLFFEVRYPYTTDVKICGFGWSKMSFYRQHHWPRASQSHRKSLTLCQWWRWIWRSKWVQNNFSSFLWNLWRALSRYV